MVILAFANSWKLAVDLSPRIYNSTKADADKAGVIKINEKRSPP